MSPWSLQCSACAYAEPDGLKLASLCPDCGQPLLARYASAVPRTAITGEASLWRYRAALPLVAGERAVTLGEISDIYRRVWGAYREAASF